MPCLTDGGGALLPDGSDLGVVPGDVARGGTGGGGIDDVAALVRAQELDGSEPSVRAVGGGCE